MQRFHPRRPSAALVISIISLIVALGGTAYAGGLLRKNSVGTKQLKNGAVTTKKLAKNAVTTAKLHKGAVTAGTLASGLTVPNASHADAANLAINSDKLGGVSASGYTQTSCNSLSGAIKGFARINDATVSTTSLSSAGVETPYNCSGGGVVAEEIGTGKYEVRFLGSPATAALATPEEASGTIDWAVNAASINRVGPGTFYVQIYNDGSHIFLDGSFVILTP
jgi:hypothetical protein